MRTPNVKLKRMKETASLFLKVINKLWSLDPAEMSRYNINHEYLPPVLVCKQLACSNLMKTNPNEVQFLISTVLALNSIPRSEAIILWDDFFSGNALTRRNSTHYSRSGFYRIRDKGIQDFFYIVDSTEVLMPGKEF